MRIDVKKVLFLGTRSNMHLFFEKAQKMGFIEFIKKEIPSNGLPEETKQLNKALKILQKHELRAQRLHPDKTPFELARLVIQTEKELDVYAEQIKLIESEMIQVAPFGHFDKGEMGFIEQKTGFKFYFFVSRKHLDQLDPNVFYIGSQYDLYYYVGVAKEPMEVKSCLALQIERPLAELLVKKKELVKALHEKEQLLFELTSYQQMIYKAYLSHLNFFHLQEAKAQTNNYLEDTVFTISGFVAQNQLERLKELTKTFNITFSLVKLEKKDRLPTFLENKKASKIGEDLVYLYDTPSPSDKDPSLWVLISFALFFSFIISDAGYGLIFLGLTLFFKYKFKAAKGSIKRFLNLALILSMGCVVWGTLTFSFFGIGIAPQSKWAQFSFVEKLVQQKVDYHKKHNDDVWQEWASRFPAIQHMQDPVKILETAQVIRGDIVKYEMQSQFNGNIMLELSLFIGAIHIILSFMRNLRRSYASVGWILFIIGGYLYFPTKVNATSFVNFLFDVSKSDCAMVGFWLLISGIIVACLLALVQNKLRGLIEITNSLQIFADVLSYIRLYALAFASIAMATTFNELAAGMNVFAAAFVLLLGHSINIVLAAMAGVIHGLRLNFLEWYHYSFEGEGRRFLPLQLLKP
jgi:V/A-type H+-transporting ATPase subunit I